jgi:hypothetical protein
MNVEPQFQANANVASLVKLDSTVVDIIANASHASMYQFDPSKAKWDKINCEGPLFIVKRNSDIRFGLIIANRLALNSFIHGVDSSFHVELVSPYIIFKSKSSENEQPIIRGLWLSEDDERKKMYDILCKCVKAQSVQQSQTVFQQSSPSLKKQETPTQAASPNDHKKIQQTAKEQQQQQQQKLQQQQQIKKTSPSTVQTPPVVTQETTSKKFLTPGMILGERNVPKLGSSSSSSNSNSDVLDMNLFKEAIRDLFEDDAFLTAVHAKYNEVLSRSN